MPSSDTAPYIQYQKVQGFVVSSPRDNIARHRTIVRMVSRFISFKSQDGTNASFSFAPIGLRRRTVEVCRVHFVTNGRNSL